jgi:spore coat protein U-like protein
MNTTLATPLLVLSMAACAGSSSAPTTPTTTTPVASVSRIIALRGTLDFGSTQVGKTISGPLTITSNGTGRMTVSVAVAPLT